MIPATWLVGTAGLIGTTVLTLNLPDSACRCVLRAHNRVDTAQNWFLVVLPYAIANPKFLE
jgi:hypothetical protein